MAAPGPLGHEIGFPEEEKGVVDAASGRFYT